MIAVHPFGRLPGLLVLCLAPRPGRHPSLSGSGAMPVGRTATTTPPVAIGGAMILRNVAADLPCLESLL